jgi:hypothetical protein
MQNETRSSPSSEESTRNDVLAGAHQGPRTAAAGDELAQQKQRSTSMVTVCRLDGGNSVLVGYDATAQWRNQPTSQNSN